MLFVMKRQINFDSGKRFLFYLFIFISFHFNFLCVCVFRLFLSFHPMTANNNINNCDLCRCVFISLNKKDEGYCASRHLKLASNLATTEKNPNLFPKTQLHDRGSNTLYLYIYFQLC